MITQKTTEVYKHPGRGKTTNGKTLDEWRAWWLAGILARGWKLHDPSKEVKTTLPRFYADD